MVKGVVVYTSPCDYFIVETALGYDLLEWYGGATPNENDRVVGDFESYGMKDIYNITQDSEMKVWVEDFWLGKDDVIEQYLEKCD